MTMGASKKFDIPLQCSIATICTVSEYTNEDGRFIEVRDAKGLKCSYRWDEGEASVGVFVASDGTVISAHVADTADMDATDE